MNRWIKLVIGFLYTLAIMGMTLYSYSQIDLNLTLSSNPHYQYLQNWLINLGYFQRNFSASIYIILVSSLFLLYLFVLRLTFVKKNNLGSLLKYLILVNVIAGIISYPGFSHDFFNYLFDARIVTKYYQNPYYAKALDFPGDLWIRFMHWTHRTYPYGPLWLISTLPFSFLGFGKFVLTLLLFKLMFAGIYVANALTIFSTMKALNKNHAVSALVFFALNPLIIIETLVSPHNESLMLLFALLSLNTLLVGKKKLLSLFLLAVSVGIKFVTAVMAPLYFFKRIYVNPDKFILGALVMLVFPLLAEIYYREAYPWYFVPLVGISSLIQNTVVSLIVLSLSFGALLRYYPYLATGEYNAENGILMNLYLIMPVLVGVIIYLCRKIFIKSDNGS